MKITRHTIQACCGKKSIIFKIDEPLSKNHLDKMVKLGFNEHPNFTMAGILYVDNMDFIVTGPFGSDKLQIKCKKDGCDQKLNDLEGLLNQLE